MRTPRNREPARIAGMATHEAQSYAVHSAPAWVEPPSLAQLLTIGSAELNFDAEHVRQLARMCGVDLSAEEAAECCQQTQGWIAGVRLALFDRLAQHARAQADAPAAASSLQPSLTQRELDLLQLLSQGLSNRDIAERCHITLFTTKWHLKNVFAKLGVGTRIAAVLRARELQLVDTNPPGGAEKKRRQRKLAAR